MDAGFVTGAIECALEGPIAILLAASFLFAKLLVQNCHMQRL